MGELWVGVLISMTDDYRPRPIHTRDRRDGARAESVRSRTSGADKAWLEHRSPERGCGYGLDGLPEPPGGRPRSRDHHSPVRSTIESPDRDIVVIPGEPVWFQGSCINTEETPRFTYAWDFGGVVAPSLVQQPGSLSFSDARVVTVSFRCTDTNGTVDEVTRAVIVNQPPQSQIDTPNSGTTVAVGERLSFSGWCRDAENHVPFSYHHHSQHTG